MAKTKKVKFKNLTDEEKEYIGLVYYEQITHKEKIEKLTAKFGVGGRTIRNWWVKLDLKEEWSNLPKQLQDAQNNSISPSTRLLFITSAQNKTPINDNLLKNMKAYGEMFEKKYGLKFEIVVIPIRYRNPTSPTESIAKKTEQWWVDDILPMLYYNKVQLGDTFISCDTHITPTSKNPLNGLEAVAGDNNLVVGHPRIHFKTQPRFRGEALRSMISTGSLSVRNYSRSRAGDNGFTHHSYGFTIVEMKEDGICHMPRAVSADADGNFIDTIYEVTNGKIKKNKSADAMIHGDIHRELLDMKLYESKKRIAKKITATNHVAHDVLDGYRFNPHERKDTFIQRMKILEGKYLIKDEVEQAVEFPSMLLKDLGGKHCYVVESNHDVFLDRHINDMDWKKDLHNSAAYMEYATITQTVDLREHGNIFGYLINQRYNNKGVTYLKYGDPLRIQNINLASHGDHGVNGSRGNIQQFKRLNTKMVHGHNHSPIIADGVISVGLSAILHQYYTRKGMSTHAHADCFIYKNGKRQLLVYGDDYKVSHVFE